MNYRQALLAIFLATGLGACATTSDYGLSYEDGSYYSAAAQGRGDYYVGAEPQRSYYYYDDFDTFFGSGYGWYGSPFYSYGGYCSARYRYCPRWAWGGGWGDGYYGSGSGYGETGFQIYFGSPWDPYWGRGYYPSQPYRDVRRRPRSADGNRGAPSPVWPQDPRTADSPPRPRPSLRDDPEDSPFPTPRSGRRSAFPRAAEDAPPRRAPAKIEGADGN